MTKIISWNVNGIRACYKKGFTEWLSTESPDIICLQETKVHKDQLPEELLNNNEYHTWYAEGVKRGYSGVSLFSKKSIPMPQVEIGIGVKKFDDEARTIIAEYKDYFLINGYFPNGQRDHGRVPFKLEYSELIVQKAIELEAEYKKPVIITGDFNTAHHPIDLANPKTNTKSTGFLPNEREWMDTIVERGFIDTFRNFHPEEPGHYTWWTYRSNCRERNIGWRIDYFFVSKSMSKKIKDALILPDVLGSDHCPIGLIVK
ncbi:MAG: exodeoxyribonuclease III [Bacteriovoracaceae bacterium]|nr:exodeoxyribonuclease III [Bacteriovoracaceae bacterium]